MTKPRKAPPGSKQIPTPDAPPADATAEKLRKVEAEASSLRDRNADLNTECARLALRLNKAETAIECMARLLTRHGRNSEDVEIIPF